MAAVISAAATATAAAAAAAAAPVPVPAPATEEEEEEQECEGLDAEQRALGFGRVLHRRGTGSVKHDLPEIILDRQALALRPDQVDDRGMPCPGQEPNAAAGDAPETPPLPERLQFWVADMDLPLCPALRDELRRFAGDEEALMGYTCLRPQDYRMVADWLQARHGFDLTVGGTVEPADVVLDAPHAVGALAGLLRAVCKPGERVAFLTPAYHPFFSLPGSAMCTPAPVPLLEPEGFAVPPGGGAAPVEDDPDAAAPSSDGYRVDWEALERTLADPKVTAFISCNPHNPVGLVFTEDDLRRLGELCADHGVFVLSDEVWCDLVLPSSPRRHVMMAGLSERLRRNTATVVSIQKTFNVAGLHMVFSVVHDADVMDRYRSYFFSTGQFGPPAIGVTIYDAAITRGEAWRAALLRLLDDNVRRLTDGLRRLCTHPGDVRVIAPQATYVVWTCWRRFMRTRRLGVPAAGKQAEGVDGEQEKEEEEADAGDRALFRLLAARARIVPEPGRDFGAVVGAGFIRINVACRPALIDALLERLAPVLALPEVPGES